MQKENKVLINNTIMMYLMCIAKLVIPLISLPYLTRVLSVDCYGSVSFVKSIVNYFQILIEFGFMLSATKDIVDIIKNKGNPNKAIGDTLFAQIFLCVISLVGMIVLCLCMDILEGFVLFALLSLVVVFLSIFLFEYVFKAYEQMGKIAIRYVLMKIIALILTLIFVKNDSHVILMPIFDIVASLVAIVMVILQMKKLGVGVDFSFKRIKDGFISLKNSFVAVIIILSPFIRVCPRWRVLYSSAKGRFLLYPCLLFRSQSAIFSPQALRYCLFHRADTLR
jgi:PST family polysaccharide transporter